MPPITITGGRPYPLIRIEKGIQRPCQRRPACSQFGTVFKREFSQYLLSFLGDTDKNTSLISLIAATLNETALREPVHQLNRAVMLKLHALGQFSNRRLPALWQSFERQQQLVLLRLNAGVTCRLLAEVQKPANLVAELG